MLFVDFIPFFIGDPGRLSKTNHLRYWAGVRTVGRWTLEEEAMAASEDGGWSRPLDVLICKSITEIISCSTRGISNINTFRNTARGDRRHMGQRFPGHLTHFCFLCFWWLKIGIAKFKILISLLERTAIVQKCRKGLQKFPFSARRLQVSHQLKAASYCTLMAYFWQLLYGPWDCKKILQCPIAPGVNGHWGIEAFSTHGWYIHIDRLATNKDDDAFEIEWLLLAEGGLS